MNVLCIGPAYPLRGGIASFNTALCRAFDRAGHNASVVSFSRQYPGFLFPGRTQFESGGPPGDVRIAPVIDSCNPVSWLRTAGFIRKEDPDLIVLHHWMPFIALGTGSVVRRFRKKSAAPVIAVVHNVVPHEKHAGWKLLTSRLLHACDGFIVLSRSVLDDLGAFTESTHVRFIPHPLYDVFGDPLERTEAAGKLGLDPAGKYLLFFGMVRRYKGLDLLIRAFARIRDIHPDVKLIVAGEFYAPKQRYLDLIRELGLEGRLVIRDEFIPSGEVRYYFSLADLVCQPYLTATQSGITQIAYHFGVPMLVTDVGGLAEIVPAGRVGYVTGIDETQVAEAITDFFSRSRAASFRRNIGEEKKRFSWDAMVSGIVEMSARIRKS